MGQRHISARYGHHSFGWVSPFSIDSQIRIQTIMHYSTPMVPSITVAVGERASLLNYA
jgi:hypothetical protein